MKAVCPACGFAAGLEAYIADAQWRQSVVAVARLPSDLGVLAMRYAGLFRPGKNALTAARAARIFGEINTLITAERIEYDRRSAQVPYRIWEQAMLKVIEMPTLKRPLKNHNLLKSIALSLLDKYDTEAAERAREADEAQAERVRLSRGRTASQLTPAVSGCENETQPEYDPLADMDADTRKMWFDRATQALLDDGFQKRFIAAPLVHAKAIELVQIEVNE